MTVAQTLQVVYGLVNNVKVVIDSAPRLIPSFPYFSVTCPLVDGEVSMDGFRQALGTFLPPPMSLSTDRDILVTMQGTAIEINKMMRSWSICPVIIVGIRF